MCQTLVGWVSGLRWGTNGYDYCCYCPLIGWWRHLHFMGGIYSIMINFSICNLHDIPQKHVGHPLFSLSSSPYIATMALQQDKVLAAEANYASTPLAEALLILNAVSTSRSECSKRMVMIWWFGIGQAHNVATPCMAQIFL